MRVIYLEKVDSTNDYLKSKSTSAPDKTVVWSDNQILGKGSFGNVWESQKGKNIAISYLLKRNSFDANNMFVLNKIVAYSLFETISNFTKCKIKWPNDIVVNDRKLAGILVENTICDNKIKYSIIGVGINLNQDFFKNLPNAISLKNIIKKDISHKKILNLFINYLNKNLSEIKNTDFDDLYNQNLFRKKEQSSFVINEKQKIGIIQKVDEKGRLVVLVDDEILRFQNKEIEFIY